MSRRLPVLTATAIALILAAALPALAAKGGNGGGGAGGGGSSASTPATLSVRDSWESGWVIYDVARTNAVDSNLRIAHTCYVGGQVVYQDFKGIYWTDSARKTGDMTFWITGERCTAYVYSGSGAGAELATTAVSAVSNVVDYKTSDFAG